jgi:hypothetical protein
MKTFLLEVKVAARDAVRMFFTPLTGAYKAVREEVQR